MGYSTIISPWASILMGYKTRKSGIFACLQGFHRYSTDDNWHVPHFEKMLYDQGQLVLCYLDAYQVSQVSFLAHKPKFSTVSPKGRVAFVGCFKESAYSIVVCNTHFAILRLFQRSG